MSDVLGIQNLYTGVGNAGVGFVVVPEDIDKETYIADCYRTNTVTISGGIGYGFFRNVPVESEVMKRIQFPNGNERGTAVIWVKEAIYQLPVVVGTLRKQDEYYPLSENQYQVKRENKNKTQVVEVFLNAQEANLEVNVLGEEFPANLNIKVNSKNKDSVVTLNCDNEINIVSDNAVRVETNKQVEIKISKEGEVKGSLKYEIEKGFEIISEQAVKTVINDERGEEVMTTSYESGKGFVYKDEFNNEVKFKDGEIKVISNKINHNSGAEAMVLGNTLKDILNSTINAITKLTVPTALGPSGVPLNIAEFKQIATKLDTILSKKSNLE